jgi:hypothetical protein
MGMQTADIGVLDLESFLGTLTIRHFSSVVGEDFADLNMFRSADD